MVDVATDDGDESRDEVVPALQLDVDLLPGFDRVVAGSSG